MNQNIVTIYEEEDEVKSHNPEESAIADEGLYGMPVKIVEELEAYYKVLTHYRYEGYVKKQDIIWKEKLECKQMAVIWPSVDVLSAPKVQGSILITLTMGALVECFDEIEVGYRRVVLLDGRHGYIPNHYLMEKRYLTDFSAYEQQSFLKIMDNLLNDYYDGTELRLREGITNTAKCYLGTQYRWGGKSTTGIDCSGLTSMSYMLNGILIYRDAKIKDGFPVKEIEREQMKQADLLYFPGHIAMYLGEGYYIHSTGKHDVKGVTINSLNPQDPLYRKDLDESLLAIGSIF